MSVAAVVFLGLGAVVAAGIVALGLWYPGTGAEQVGWRSARSRTDAEARGDAEDLAQLLEATNARRRARGERELTVDGLLDEVRRGGPAPRSGRRPPG
jgi:hypothetical protein